MFNNVRMSKGGPIFREYFRRNLMIKYIMRRDGYTNAENKLVKKLMPII